MCQCMCCVCDCVLCVCASAYMHEYMHGYMTFEGNGLFPGYGPIPYRNMLQS